jgi:hypothetical protein
MHPFDLKVASSFHFILLDDIRHHSRTTFSGVGQVFSFVACLTFVIAARPSSYFRDKSTREPSAITCPALPGRMNE